MSAAAPSPSLLAGQRLALAGEREHRGIRHLYEAYRTASSSTAEPLDDLATRLYRCALDHRLPYPREILAVLIGRVRSNDKEGASTRRMALIKAVAIR